jgi:hypothetical protein
MYKEAVKKAQNVDGKKVGFNLQIPSYLKGEFEHQCKQDNVTVTSMIISLMEVSLVESYLSTVPKVEKALSDLKKVLNSDDIFIPYAISKDNPMYSTTVSEADFSKLMEIDLALALGIDEFNDYYHIAINSPFSHRVEALNLLESARSYIKRISHNMDKREEFNAVQEEYMDITMKKFKKNADKE